MIPKLDMLDPGTDMVRAIEENGAIATWTDHRRDDFCKTFADRVRVSRYILECVAESVQREALKRRFIGEKNLKAIKTPSHDVSYLCDMYSDSAHWRNNRDSSICAGRPTSQLREIANERAKAILDNLPTLSTAVQIINPELAKKIDRRDALTKKGQELTDQLLEASEAIVMSELDQGMTVGAFLEMVRQRDKLRAGIHTELAEVSEEGRELEIAIAKALYSGLPGLSDAVIKVINDHYARSNALDEITRRVTEQVKFGNSPEALEMLRRFEGDEVSVPDSIKDQFKAALEALKLSVGGKKVKAPKKLA